ncbi:MAG TPA: hypothetical protein ENO03_06110 [Candidatus Aminicenantes bacterium]|nr:hypothetical protein [Candidatus Aminicenantes bacterium]HDT13917.1 hypothetical protein [Candidatus Aminicenantes bacterium]
MAAKRALLCAGFALWGLAAPALGGGPPPQIPFAFPPVEKTVAVDATAGWVDTGLDVGAGDELHFLAFGEIDLQRGNPGAVCGPRGIDLVTVDQPIPDANLGALVGKVAQLVAARIDEDSGQEVRDEIFALFLVGEERAVTVPFKGRLYLGVNENVFNDNGGGFSVVVIRRPR